MSDFYSIPQCSEDTSHFESFKHFCLMRKGTKRKFMETVYVKLQRLGECPQRIEHVIFDIFASEFETKHLHQIYTSLLEYSSSKPIFYFHIMNANFSLKIRFAFQHGSFNPSGHVSLLWEEGNVAKILMEIPTLNLWNDSWIYFRGHYQATDYYLCLLTQLKFVWNDTDVHHRIEPFRDLMQNLDQVYKKPILEIIYQFLPEQNLSYIIFQYIGNARVRLIH